MDYKGWVLSIYDEYVKRYNEEKNIKNEKLNFKNIIKVLFKKGNRIIGSVLLIYLISTIGLFVLYLINRFSSIPTIIFLETALLCLIIYSQIYKYEMDIQTYRKRVSILREVLIEEGLYNENFIKNLRSYTGSIFYKVNEKIRNLFKTIFGVGTITGAGYVLEKINQEIITVIALVLFSIAIVVYDIYLFMSMIPNNRITRKQKFHQMLNILISYDFESKLIIEKSQNNTTLLDEIKEKDAEYAAAHPKI